jgi:hypothetical protein
MPPWIMAEKGRKMSWLGDWLKGHVAGNHEISWDWPHLHQSTIQNAMFCRFCPPSLDTGEILQNYLVKIPSGTSNLNRLRQRHGFSLSKRQHPTPMYSEIQACQCMSCLFPMHLHFRRFLEGVRLQLKKQQRDQSGQAPVCCIRRCWVCCNSGCPNWQWDLWTYGWYFLQSMNHKLVSMRHTDQKNKFNQINDILEFLTAEIRHCLTCYKN